MVLTGCRGVCLVYAYDGAEEEDCEGKAAGEEGDELKMEKIWLLRGYGDDIKGVWPLAIFMFGASMRLHPGIDQCKPADVFSGEILQSTDPTTICKI